MTAGGMPQRGEAPAPVGRLPLPKPSPLRRFSAQRPPPAPAAPVSRVSTFGHALNFSLSTAVLRATRVRTRQDSTAARRPGDAGRIDPAGPRSAQGTRHRRIGWRGRAPPAWAIDSKPPAGPPRACRPRERSGTEKREEVLPASERNGVGFLRGVWS